MKFFKVAGILVVLFCIQFQVQAQDSSNYFKSFDGTPIYYEVNGAGPAVLLVHGFIVNGESWKKTALYTDLLTAGYKVITLDMRGNGKSGKPHNAEAYANDAEAKDIMRLIKLLGIRKYIAVGYSRGSIITARLMVLDPKLKRAVMGGMGTDFTNPEWPRRIMFYHALRGDSIPELAGVVKYVQDAKLDQEALALLQKEQPSTSKKKLGKVKIPVLVISGDSDSDNGSAQELAQLFRNAKYVTVPGDHNHAHLSKEFADAVTDFIDEGYRSSQR
jgi:pimeloyl-ACP methyl ester carboxylesterase